MKQLKSGSVREAARDQPDRPSWVAQFCQPTRNQRFTDAGRNVMPGRLGARSDLRPGLSAYVDDRRHECQGDHLPTVKWGCQKLRGQRRTEMAY